MDILRMYSAEPKKIIKTWSDRLTGKNNLWLEAINTEDDGNFQQATMLYLRDATQCWDAGLKARAALSCSCAASCFMHTNNLKLGHILYAEAALMYEDHAQTVLDRSIRESFWTARYRSSRPSIARNDAKAAGFSTHFFTSWPTSNVCIW